MKPFGPTALWLMAVLVAASSPAMAGRRFPQWMQLSEPKPLAEAQQQWREFQRPFGESGLKFKSSSVGVGSGLDYWHFNGSPGATSPTWAFHYREPKKPPYRIVVDRFCDQLTCEALNKELLGLRAPRPDYDEVLRAEWRRIVAEEPCDPLRPVRIRLPTRPETGIKAEAGDVVELKAFHNKCGDIREAIVSKSSGDQRLDGHATIWVSGWRIANPSMSAGWTLETIRFPIAPERLPPDTAPKPTPRD